MPSTGGNLDGEPGAGQQHRRPHAQAVALPKLDWLEVAERRSARCQ
jgi:hypothetical protein